MICSSLTGLIRQLHLHFHRSRSSHIDTLPPSRRSFFSFATLHVNTFPASPSSVQYLLFFLLRCPSLRYPCTDRPARLTLGLLLPEQVTDSERYRDSFSNALTPFILTLFQRFLLSSNLQLSALPTTFQPTIFLVGAACLGQPRPLHDSTPCIHNPNLDIPYPISISQTKILHTPSSCLLFQSPHDLQLLLTSIAAVTVRLEITSGCAAPHTPDATSHSPGTAQYHTW